MEAILDIYTDYLQVSFGQATATGLSSMVGGAVSHDQITRFLSNNDFNSKDLWLSAKDLVREHETDSACLIFDDSISEKPYTDENDLIAWHYDHTKGYSVKGINIITAFYHTQAEGQKLPLRVPVGFEPILKTTRYCERATQKEKRISPVTKNQLLQQMFTQALQNQLKFTYVLSDSWYSSSDNMRFIDRHKKTFIFDLKTNRMVAANEQERNASRWTRIDELPIPTHTPTQVWLKDLSIPVLLVKQVFTNKDSSTGVRYLVSNDLNMSYEIFENTYKKRWSIEEYHKSIKQNTALQKSPTRTVQTQRNHLFASILAYVKFEKYKIATNLNHFALKAKLYLVATKAAFNELNTLKLTGCNLVPA